MELADIRLNYSKHTLNEAASGNNPAELFSHWLKEAVDANVTEPSAMVLSTVSEHNRPSSRVVLLKGFNEGRFVFYSNYNSRKGRDIDSNQFVSLLFFWPELERQVRVEGVVSRESADTSDKYFNSRPLESRIGAIISPQSKVIEGREDLEIKFSELMAQSDPGQLKRPDYWGGYVVDPGVFEFWQGRPGRLHDRIRFRKDQETWIRERLAP